MNISFMRSILYAFIFLSHPSFCYAQKEAPKDSFPSDMALYDRYNCNYMVSQPIKYTIQGTSVGFLFGLASSIIYLNNNKPKTVESNNLGNVIVALSMTTFFTGAGFITGAIRGLYQGEIDEALKIQNTNFYHSANNFGYEYGFTVGEGIKGRLFPEIFLLSYKTNTSQKFYIPEKIDILLANGRDDYREYANGNLTSFDISGTSYGIGLYNYLNKRSFLNFFYGIGTGYFDGKKSTYYNYRPNTYYDYSYWYLVSEQKHSSIYFNTQVGMELNIFDFVHGNLTATYEPIGAYESVKGRQLYLRATFGSYIF